MERETKKNRVRVWIPGGRSSKQEGSIQGGSCSLDRYKEISGVAHFSHDEGSRKNKKEGGGSYIKIRNGANEAEFLSARRNIKRMDGSTYSVLRMHILVHILAYCVCTYSR